MSIKFLSAILGPEMGAPILWTPGKNEFFLQEKPMSIRFLILGGGGGYFGFGGGKCRFYFYVRGDFSDSGEPPVETAPRNCRFLSLVVVELVLRLPKP